MLPRDNQGVRLSDDVMLRKEHLYLTVSALLYLLQELSETFSKSAKAPISSILFLLKAFLPKSKVSKALTLFLQAYNSSEALLLVLHHGVLLFYPRESFPPVHFRPAEVRLLGSVWHATTPRTNGSSTRSDSWSWLPAPARAAGPNNGERHLCHKMPEHFRELLFSPSATQLSNLGRFVGLKTVAGGCQGQYRAVCGGLLAKGRDKSVIAGDERTTGASSRGCCGNLVVASLARNDGAVVNITSGRTRCVEKISPLNTFIVHNGCTARDSRSS